MKLKIDAGSIWLTKEYPKWKKVLSSLFRIKLPYNSYGFFLQESEIDTDKLLSDNIIILSPTVKYSLLEIKELNVYKSDANYFMIKLNKGKAEEIAEYLLDSKKILIKVLNGKNGFDDNEYIRIAIKSKEENDYLLESIKEYYL